MSGNIVVSVCSTALSLVVRKFATVVRVVAFWAAILMPMLYVPLLLLGHPTATDLPVLGTLIALNVAAIVVGSGSGGALGEEGESVRE